MKNNFRKRRNCKINMSSDKTYFVISVQNHTDASYDTMQSHINYITKDKRKALEVYNNLPKSWDKFVLIPSEENYERYLMDGIINCGKTIIREDDYDHLSERDKNPDEVKLSSEKKFGHYAVYVGCESYPILHEDYLTTSIEDACKRFDELVSGTNEVPSVWDISASDFLDKFIYLVGLSHDQYLPKITKLPILRYYRR